MSKTPAKPPHYELGPAPASAPPGYIQSHIILSLTPDTSSAPAKILFTMMDPNSTGILVSGKDYTYIAIKQNTELTIELAAGIEWEWDWDSKTSGPITCKNDRVDEFFYGVRGQQGDSQVKFYIKYNTTPITKPEDYMFEFNFHVILGQTGRGKLKITIDPQVDNPAPYPPLLPPASVFALSE